MNPEWQAKVESALSNHDKDISSIAGSLKGIEKQMHKTNEILQDFALKDERFNSKIDQLETRCTARFERSEQAIARAHSRVDKIEANLSRAVWIVLTAVILGVLSATLAVNGA